MGKLIAAVGAVWVALTVNVSAELPKIRIGALKVGTFNWELSTIRDLKLDEKHGFRLEVRKIASNAGSLIALQSGEVDVIVTNWFWVSNQRARGRMFTSVPYSQAVGALLVGKNSPVRSLADLKGRKVGISGGPRDKLWILTQALTIKQLGYNIAQEAEAVFAAPPLIAKKLEQGELDGAMLFWHFAAKLNARGYPTLIDGAGLMRDVGLSDVAPLLVYAFPEKLAKSKPKLISSYIRASYAAKQVLLDSDAAWIPLRPKMRARDERTYRTLIQAWRAGVPRAWGEPEQRNVERLFEIVHKVGGDKLVASPSLSPGTFWSSFRR